MKLQNKDLPALLRAEIFHQLGVDDPGGGIATSHDGETVYFGDDEAKSRSVVVLADAYNMLNITNLERSRKVVLLQPPGARPQARKSASKSGNHSFCGTGRARGRSKR